MAKTDPERARRLIAGLKEPARASLRLGLPGARSGRPGQAGRALGPGRVDPVDRSSARSRRTPRNADRPGIARYRQSRRVDPADRRKSGTGTPRRGLLEGGRPHARKTPDPTTARRLGAVRSPHRLGRACDLPGPLRPSGGGCLTTQIDQVSAISPQSLGHLLHLIWAKVAIDPRGAVAIIEALPPGGADRIIRRIESGSSW